MRVIMGGGRGEREIKSERERDEREKTVLIL